MSRSPTRASLADNAVAVPWSVHVVLTASPEAYDAAREEIGQVGSSSASTSASSGSSSCDDDALLTHRSSACSSASASESGSSSDGSSAKHAEPPPSARGRARWLRSAARIDTGAETCAVPSTVMKRLALRPIGRVTVVDGSQHRQRRDVVSLCIHLGGYTARVEATVRYGRVLGRTPIIGKNFLRMFASEVHPLLVYVPAHGKLSLRFDHAAATAVSTISPSSRSSRDTCSASSSNKASTTSSASDGPVGPAFRCDPSSELVLARPALERKAVVIRFYENARISNPAQAKLVSLVKKCKVDTGAHLCAVPRSLVRQLDLPSVDRVHVRSSSDVLQLREVVAVRITVHAVSCVVRATVRDSPGVLIGRNFLSVQPLYVRAD